MLKPTTVSLRWDSVSGTVSGWEIQVDGSKVATAGPLVRTTRVKAVDGRHTVTVVDLPARLFPQTLELVGEVI